MHSNVKSIYNKHGKNKNKNKNKWGKINKRGMNEPPPHPHELPPRAPDEHVPPRRPAVGHGQHPLPRTQIFLKPRRLLQAQPRDGRQGQLEGGVLAEGAGGAPEGVRGGQRGIVCPSGLPLVVALIIGRAHCQLTGSRKDTNALMNHDKCFVVNYINVVNYLTGKYLTGKYLTGKYLTGKYLTSKYFTGKYFTGNYLTGKNFTGKYLTGNYFTDIDVTRNYITRNYFAGNYFTGN